jgi:hypothetical protein
MRLLVPQVRKTFELRLCGSNSANSIFCRKSGVPIRSQLKLPLAVAYIGAGSRHDFDLQGMAGSEVEQPDA